MNFVFLHIPSVLVTATLLLNFPCRADADRTSQIQAQLRDFKTDPYKEMNRIPVKRDVFTGRAASPSPSRFSQTEIRSGDFVLAKDTLRKKFCRKIDGQTICLGDDPSLKSAYQRSDLAEDLVDNGAALLRSLKAMDERHLTGVFLEETPWSDTYWPIYLGLLGVRYADYGSPRSRDWTLNERYSHSEATELKAIVTAKNAEAIDSLSPSEKYDLLLGDPDAGLTAASWETGAGFYKQYGEVETWMGICHGWAPASYMVQRPLHTVQLLAADGHTPLTFYPADIRGLASLLWARSQTPVRFAGNRCNDKNPAMDQVGRILSQRCFDTNPGTWHLSVVNQLGVSKRSMVIDATYDYEVWNQPLAGYEYTYFNPQTGQPVKSMAEASVTLAQYSDDKFKGYRSKKAVVVVGVAMDLTYMEETEPSHEPTDSHEADHMRMVRYLYDLELDAKGEIIGGEWYTNAHPDFAWTPAPGSSASSDIDRDLTESWNGTGPLPESWTQAASRSSRIKGSPLTRVVDLLVALSRL